jgi:hypothetical protein
MELDGRIERKLEIVFSFHWTHAVRDCFSLYSSQII